MMRLGGSLLPAQALLSLKCKRFEHEPFDWGCWGQRDNPSGTHTSAWRHGVLDVKHDILLARLLACHALVGQPRALIAIPRTGNILAAMSALAQSWLDAQRHIGLWSLPAWAG